MGGSWRLVAAAGDRAGNRADDAQRHVAEAAVDGAHAARPRDVLDWRALGGGICLALCERFGGGLQSMAPRLMDCSAPPMAPKPKPMLSSSAAILPRRARF